MLHLVTCCVTVVTCIGITRADEPMSGPQVGKEAGGFELEMATGEMAGKKLDYLGSLKDKPVLVIFIAEMTRPGFGLLKQLDKYGRLRQPEGLEVLIVRLTDDAPAAIKHTRLLNDMYDIKSPGGVATSGKHGPMEYGLHEDAQMTVLLLDKEHKVVINVARRAPERQDFAEVRKGIDKLLGPSPVSFP